jgi:retron-type reverse transcriptase
MVLSFLNLFFIFSRSIKNYYENLKIYVQDNKHQISVPFMSTVGVKQGGPASPDLFNDYIDSLIITLDESGKTYDFGGLKKGTMVYADDTTLVCDNINNLKANPICMVI